MTELEKLVQDNGLSAVVQKLIDLCFSKAKKLRDSIEGAWEIDETMEAITAAESWEIEAEALNKFFD